MQLYYSGAQWWPDDEFERQHIQPQQEDRFEADVWEDLITSWINGRQRITVKEVATEAIGIAPARISRADQNRIIAVLEGLGWKRVRDWKGRAYVRP